MGNQEDMHQILFFLFVMEASKINCKGELKDGIRLFFHYCSQKKKRKKERWGRKKVRGECEQCFNWVFLIKYSNLKHLISVSTPLTKCTRVVLISEVIVECIHIKKI